MLPIVLFSVRTSDYREQVGVVLQQDFLFDGTIGENIAYGNPQATREQIRQAGALANCHEFVESLSSGYDTTVGERGVRLSGGQRQRIAIARALLKAPRILVLDEATSNLDRENEALVQGALERLREGRTTLIIAHRMSTIERADQILVLDRGRIVADGTHGELLSRSSDYRKLHGAGSAA